MPHSFIGDTTRFKMLVSLSYSVKRTAVFMNVIAGFYPNEEVLY